MEISTNTPAGRIFARVLIDPEYPGIDIYMLDENGAEVNLALVEYIPGGESCDMNNRIPGDIIDPSRTEYNNIELWSGEQKACPVLTAGLMARVWEDGEREDPH